MKVLTYNDLNACTNPEIFSGGGLKDNWFFRGVGGPMHICDNNVSIT